MIAEAERPIVIAGRGAMLVRRQGARSRRWPRQSGALLATSLLGKGLFDGNPFALDIAGTFASDLGRECFAESDLVIGVGAGLGHYTTEGGYLFPDAQGGADRHSTRAACGRGCAPPICISRPMPGPRPRRSSRG